jgi:hypothetical protein
MNGISSNNIDDPPRRGPTIIVPALWTAGENSGRPLTAEEQALLTVISTVVRFRRGERIYALLVAGFDFGCSVKYSVGVWIREIPGARPSHRWKSDIRLSKIS